MEVGDIRNIESEAGVIATLVLRPEFIFYSDHLLPNYFTDKQNAYLYYAISQIAKFGGNKIEKMDAFTITNQLNIKEATRDWERYFSLQALKEFIENDAKIIARNTVEEYMLLVNNVVDAAFRRNTYMKLEQCKKYCFNADEQDIEQKIYKTLDDVLMEFSTVSDVPQYKDVVDNYWNDIEARQSSNAAGIPFKFDTLNAYATIERSELFIFAADAKTGKSAMLLNCAVDLLKRDIAVFYVDSELNSRLFTIRLLSHLTGIAFAKIKNGRYTDEEREQIMAAKEWLKTRKFTHLYMPMFDAKTLYSAVKKVYHTQGVDVLIVDYCIVHIKPIELLENHYSRTPHSTGMKQAQMRRFEKCVDLAISSQALNRSGFNDYPVWSRGKRPEVVGTMKMVKI